MEYKKFTVENTLNLEPLRQKIESFNWNFYTCNGHNHKELYKTLKNNFQNKKPSLFLCHTVKGYGVSFMQNNILSWINYDPLVIFYIICGVLTVLWIWIINLFNFMDGMDGLTCIQVLLLAILTNLLSVFGFLSENFQHLSLVLISLFLAFFKFNRPPAKIFLGDVGSIPVGFITGLILIKALLNNGPFIPIIIVLMFYFFDSTITLFIRLIKKKKIMQAHSDHFYQKILRAGQTHNQVLKKIIVLLIALLFLSMLSLNYPLFSFSIQN